MDCEIVFLFQKAGSVDSKDESDLGDVVSRERQMERQEGDPSVLSYVAAPPILHLHRAFPSQNLDQCHIV